MNNATQTATEYLTRCIADFDAAMVKRDAIEDCFSTEWRLAHATARTAAIAKRNAYAHAYAAGLLPKPYWA